MPVRLSGREAKKLLPPVGLSGRSAEELRQEGIAIALNPVRALESGSPSTVVPRSDAGSQECWTDREAPHSRAPNSSLSLLSVRLEPGDLVDIVAMDDPAEPIHYERRSARGREPLAIRAATSAAGRDALPLSTTRSEPPTVATADYAEEPQ